MFSPGEETGPVDQAVLLLGAVLAQLPVGVIVRAPGGRMLLSNEHTERILGRAPLPTFCPEPVALRLDGTPLPVEESPMARALRGEVVTDFEHLWLRPDGGCAQLRIRAMPVRAEGGHLVAGLEVLEDITERRRAERAQALLDEVGCAIAAAVDVEAALRDVAARAVTRFADACVVDLTARDAELRRLTVFHRDPDKAGAIERHTELAPARGAQGPVARAIESGEPRWLARSEHDDLASCISAPLRARGEVVGAITFVREATSRPYLTEDVPLAEEIGDRLGMLVANARLVDKAQAAARDRDEAIAIVSHDLRNPLHAIHLNTELLAKVAVGRLPHERVGRAASAISRATGEMERLIKDLLDVSRIQRGTLRLEPRSAEPSGLIEGALGALSATAEKRSLCLEAEVQAPLPEVVVDAERITQVLLNLIGNALKFTPPGGRVIVRSERVDEGVRFSVADTGPGIPEADHARVFERFYQGHRDKPPGSGLGLAIAKGLVEAHGGRIWLESRPGEGSTFTFELPLRPPTG